MNNKLMQDNGTKSFCTSMMDSFPMPVWRSNCIGQCEYLNKVWLDFVGIKHEEATGYGWLQTFHIEDRERCEKIFLEAFQKKAPFEMEHRMKRFDGEYRWVVSIGAPYYDQERNFGGYIGTIYDLTDRKTAEEGRTRYEVLVQRARDIILFLDTDGNIIDANEAAVKAYGYSLKELCTINIRALCAEGKITREFLEKADRDGVFLESIHYRKDGTTFPVEISSQGSDISGKRVIVSIIRDITERKKAEMALKESEGKFRNLFNSAADAIFLQTFSEDSDKISRFIEVNDVACKRLGYSRDELLGMTSSQIIAPRNHQAARYNLEKLKEKSHITIENVHIAKDGREIPVEVNIQSFELQGRQVWLSIARDITERKEAENIIRESESKYQSLFQNMVNGFSYNRIVLDEKGTPVDYIFLEVNEAFEEFTRLRREQVVGKRASEVFKTEINKDWLEMCYRSAYFGEAFRNDDTYTKIYGKWVSTSIYSPKKEYFAVMFYDITERVNNNLELKASRAKYQKLLMNMNNGFGYFEVIYNDGKYPVDCCFIEVNKALEDITGFTSQQLIGKTLLEIFPELKTVLHEFFAVLTGVSVGEGHSFKDFLIENTQKWCSVYLYSPEEDRFAVILVDITEEQKASEAMKKAKEAAEAANRTKSEFLANMSHEIRTPLNGIVGMIDLTLLDELSDSQKENLNIAKKCADSLSTIINDILDFSRIEAGKLVIENIDFSLKQLVEEIIKSHSPRANEKNLELNYMYSSSVPDFLSGDPSRLQQVLNNLISNAIKFTESGSVSLIIKSRYVSRDEVELKFSVEDTGIGIEQEEMNKLFKSFSQIDGSQTRKYGGTGLGLVISRQLVELMSGSIWVESHKGTGSTFSLAIRFKTGRPVKKQKKEKKAGAPSKELRILMVEDDKVNQQVIELILLKKGYYVDTANNGIEALALHEKNNYDIILMDIQMPEMDGIEATQCIRQREGSSRHTPIIALTAHTLLGDRERFLAKGMDEYIPKPIVINKMVNTIEEVYARFNGEDITINGVRLNDNGEIVFVEGKNYRLNDDNKYIISHIEEYIKQLIDVSAASDLAGIAEVSGKIKSLANEIEADDLKNSAFRIELAARRGNLKDVLVHVMQLGHEFETFKKAVS